MLLVRLRVLVRVLVLLLLLLLLPVDVDRFIRPWTLPPHTSRYELSATPSHLARTEWPSGRPSPGWRKATLRFLDSFQTANT